MTGPVVLQVNVADTSVELTPEGVFHQGALLQLPTSVRNVVLTQVGSYVAAKVEGASARAGKGTCGSAGPG